MKKLLGVLLFSVICNQNVLGMESKWVDEQKEVTSCLSLPDEIIILILEFLPITDELYMHIWETWYKCGIDSKWCQLLKQSTRYRPLLITIYGSKPGLDEIKIQRHISWLNRDHDKKIRFLKENFERIHLVLFQLKPEELDGVIMQKIASLPLCTLGMFCCKSDYFGEFKNIENLRVLLTVHCSLTDEDWISFSQSERMQNSIRVVENRFSGPSKNQFVIFNKFKKLVDLRISKLRQVDTVSIHRLKNLSKKLKTLHMPLPNGNEVDCINKFTAFAAIEELMLKESCINQDAVRIIGNNFPKLRKLVLVQCENTYNESAEQLLKERNIELQIYNEND